MEVKEFQKFFIDIVKQSLNQLKGVTLEWGAINYIDTVEANVLVDENYIDETLIVLSDEEDDVMTTFVNDYIDENEELEWTDSKGKWEISGWWSPRRRHNFFQIVLDGKDVMLGIGFEIDGYKLILQGFDMVNKKMKLDYSL